MHIYVDQSFEHQMASSAAIEVADHFLNNQFLLKLILILHMTVRITIMGNFYLTLWTTVSLWVTIPLKLGKGGPFPKTMNQN